MTTREHGTNGRYQAGCHCAACSRAHYHALVRRRAALVRGDWQPWTEAAPVRDHVRQLLAAGLTEKNVADLAGVSAGAIAHLMHGSTGRQPSKRIRPAAAAAILAVRPSAAAALSAGTVVSAGTVRRLQALVACGWTMQNLAAQLGVKPTNLTALMQRPSVNVASAAAVRALYDRLWNQAPPEDTKRQSVAARQARARAAARGWPPPLAWDDDTIDNPDATPADGWQRPGRLPTADLLAEATELIRWEGSRELAAIRLGVSRGTLDRAIARSGQSS